LWQRDGQDVPVNNLLARSRSANHRMLVSRALELLIPAQGLTGWPRFCGVSMIAKELQSAQTANPSRS
jgi:hypothetical protein